MGVAISEVPGVWSVPLLILIVLVVSVLVAVAVRLIFDKDGLVALGVWCLVAILLGISAELFYSWQEERADSTPDENLGVVADHYDVHFFSVFRDSYGITPASPGRAETIPVSFVPSGDATGQRIQGVIQITDNTAVLLVKEGADSSEGDSGEKVVEYSGGKE